MSNSPQTPARPARMLSLDVLRGLTLGFMILVNNDADGEHAYWALKHAAWNGFTPTDLVFPTFLFLVGISTVFSTATRLARGATRKALFLHTLWRAILLFFFGLVVNTFPFQHLDSIRVYGVLPRIAVCYFVVATLYLISPGWRDKVALIIVALAGYWVLMRFVPVPGYGMPVRDVPLLDRDGNLTAWLDRQIFSAKHLYEQTRDPEGLLSTLPALGTALLGMLTGIWLRTERTVAQKARGIVIAGVSGVLLGGLWNFTFPINKKLWTSSYVLFAAGLSLLLLALSIWIVDILNSPDRGLSNEQRNRRFMPFLVFGMNAIGSYILSELLPSILTAIHVNKGNIVQWYYGGILHIFPDIPFASLLYSISFVALCWVPMYVLYRRKIFLKI